MTIIFKFNRSQVGLSPFEENKAENRINVYSTLNAYIRILAAKIGLGAGVIKFVDNNHTYYMGKETASRWINSHSLPQQQPIPKRTNAEMIKVMKQICLQEVENQKTRGRGAEDPQPETPPDTTPPNPPPVPPRSSQPSAPKPQKKPIKPEETTTTPPPVPPRSPQPSVSIPQEKPVKPEETTNTTQDAPSTAEPQVDVESLSAKAEAGDSQAQADLGKYYIEQEDYIKAEEWLIKSVANKNADGLYAAAFLHAEGLAKNPDQKIAFKYCFQASKQGHVHAKLQLAHMHQTGFADMRINNKQALVYLEDAAKISEEGKLHLIKFLLRNKTNNPTPSSFEIQYAYKVCQEAVEKHENPRVEILNYMSTLELQHKNDRAAAFKYTEMAAKQQDPTAELNLANMYYNGFGTTQSFEKAFEWYGKAAAAGAGEAQALLAFMHYNGIGCKASEDTAKAYMKQAAAHKDPAVASLLAQLFSKS